MEILLSKLIPLFIYPVGLLFCILLITVILMSSGRPRAARALAVFALLLLFVAGNKWTAFSLIRGLENDYPPLAVDKAPAADVIVVLGGGLGLPHPPRRYPDLNGSADRLAHALRLYQAGKAGHILLTGGNVFPEPGLKSESFYARDLLQSWGLPPGVAVLETDSRNTIQNAENSARILTQRGWEKVLLVTSATHMHRALTAFRHAGVDAIPAPTDFLAVDRNTPAVLDWIPSADALSGTTHALHEYIGRLWYRIRLR